MADNTPVLNPNAINGGRGDTIATDDIDGVKYQRVKITIGDDGVNDGDMSGTNPLPVTGSVTTGGLTDAELRATPVTALLNATQDNGNAAPVSLTSEGHLEVALHSPVLPFGAVHCEGLTPIFQCDAIYGLNASQVETTTGLGYDPGPAPGTSSGTNTNPNGMFKCSTGTTAYSFATIQTRRRLRYRAGQGVVGRFAGFWSTPAASSTVVSGFGSGESGYYFGYNGTSFGILHSTGGVREIQTFTVTAATSSGGTATFRLNGLDYTVTLATSATTVLTANDIARQTFPGWDVEARGSTVVFLANAVGDKTGTFSISLGTAVDTAGTFAETTAGVASTDTWIAQEDWNVDPCDGTGASSFTLDPSKGNVFQIGIAWLGFGPVTFSVYVPGIDGNNATWERVHTINNPNTRITPHVSQPSFPFTMAAYSSGSTTDVSVAVGSLAGFIEGQKYSNGPRMSYYTTSGVTSSTSVYTPIFSARNGVSYGSRANQTVINLLSIGGAAKSNTGVTSFYLIRNATLAGPVSWGAYSSTSCSYFDTGATSCTFSNNNQVIWTGSTTGDGQFVFPFSDEITLQPGETVTLAVRSVTATAVCVGQLNTREDQ